jgi:DNA-binding IclR family transcriptional regulator
MESGSGYVILAHQVAAQRERTLAEWSRETGKKPPRDLEVHLERIRKAGYEKRASYLVKGIVNISFPIFDDRGSPLGALTVPHIQYNESTKRSIQVIKLLREAAEQITLSIGGKRPLG